MATYNFKVNDRVRIRGDHLDYTEHLEGCLGTVVNVNKEDCLVNVDGQGHWFIWMWNLSHA